MTKQITRWAINLMVDCPSCSAYFDHTQSDYWAEGGMEAFGGDFSNWLGVAAIDIEARSDECGHEFKFDIEEGF